MSAITTLSDPSAPFSVATAIALGLIASFIQSLGLTIQRKSHLLNESLAPARRKTEWKRPLWLVGFAIFLVANIGGTVFQIGALPIVMLAPLGAVSMLYNAVLARFLLNDLLSKYMVMGTALIASGAVLIGYFGVVPSPPHSLDELLDLYARPTFVAFATIFTFVFVGVLTVSHLAEWQLHTRIYRNSLPARPAKPKHRSGHSLRGRLRRRWSAPTLAPVAEVSESSSGIATPVLANRDEANRRSTLGPSPQQQTVLYGRSIVATPMPLLAADPSAVAAPLLKQSDPTAATSKRDYGSLGRSELSARKRKKSLDVPRLELREAEQRIDAETVKQTKLGLSVAYGGASGTLSGACLLLAKSDVELLMLTFSGQNQFGRWQSWLLVGILLAAALLQLWYLNKALKLADPTLVCPLAFCFYNTSSIALGLVYFDQIGALAWYDLVLVAVGTAVLLAGVWTVSLHGNDEPCDSASVCGQDENQPLLSHASPGASYEGLMAANGAGVAGPHLPPLSTSPHSSSFVDHNVTSLASPEEATLAMHPQPHESQQSGASNSSSMRTTPRLGAHPAKRRTGSTGHATAQRRPTITLEFPLRDDLFSPTHDAAFAHDVEAHAGSGASAAPHHSPESSVSDHEHRRKPSLYNSILEHGLSIGISPSSPGFHLQPRSPSLSRANSSWQHTGRHVQRSMSEADAPSTVAGYRRQRAERHEASDESTEQADGAASSGFAIMFDQMDLSRRLEAIGISRESGRRWWSRWRPRWARKRAEEEPFLVASNSNGSLMAVPRSQAGTQGLGLALGSDRSAASTRPQG
ncbi:conserved hypothetical protein [Sporisorium reilianum SRZ2]|uniref:Uncharacterized protein n=1 Tax=Sporisorium reilianum (strain SRZ2) TaxID=999809 RepID=E7A1S3_SPORE|nr:conserved hypothetical protein [Sporisorium reilianum SRZ2]